MSIQWILFLIQFAWGNAEFSNLKPGDWLCPEYGPCHLHAVLGACESHFYFEYSQKFHVKGQSSFWESDRPKPCAMTLRTPSGSEKFTFDRFKCEEVLRLLQEAYDKFESEKFPDGDLIDCSPSDHGGRFVVVRPSDAVRDGKWQSPRRESILVKGAEGCTSSNEDHLFVCPEMDAESREWLQELLGKIKWRVRGAPFRGKVSAPRPRLAPGDRAQED